MAEQRYSLGGGAYPAESYGNGPADIDMRALRPGTPGSMATRASMGYAESAAPSQSDALIQGQPGSPAPDTYYFNNDKEGYNAGGVSSARAVRRAQLLTMLLVHSRSGRSWSGGRARCCEAINRPSRLHQASPMADRSAAASADRDRRWRSHRRHHGFEEQRRVGLQVIRQRRRCSSSSYVSQG